MNYRAKSLWLPGLLTLILTYVAAVAFAWAGIKPHFISLTQAKGGPFFVVSPLLFCLPFIGALGAHWSRRLGGGPRRRVLAALFPAIFWGFLSTVMLFLELGLGLDRNVPPSLRLTALAAYLLNWSIIPGIALLVGTVPFLRNGRAEPTSSGPHQHAASC